MVRAVLRNKKEDDVNPKLAARIRPLIRRGVALMKKGAQAKIALEEVNARLLPYAEDLRETTGLGFSIFKSDQGAVAVKFGDAITYDEKDMPKIKKILGPRFSTMFSEVPVCAVNQSDIPEIRKKLGKDFDRLVSVDMSYSHTKALWELLRDGDSKVGKKLRALVKIEAKKPAFAYEEPQTAALETARPTLATVGKKKDKAA